MRKLVAVGVLIGGLLAGAGTAMAQGGNADRLSLASSGVLIPYITGGAAGLVATVEVASPVGPNLGLHMVFFNTTCDRIGSASLPETTNDIGFVQIAATLAPLANPSGLVAIAGTVNGTSLNPLLNPIHSRVYEFGAVDGRSRIFEPIIVDSWEFPGTNITTGVGQSFWSPLRTAATFFAPLEVTGSVATVLTLTCPRATIQNTTVPNVGVFTINAGFPRFTVNPGPTSTGTAALAFNTTSTPMSGRVYDTNEIFLRDVNFTCDCLTINSPANDWTGGAIYKSTSDPANGIGATLGTYTEIEVTDPNGAGTSAGAFTAWREVATVGSALNIFFGPVSDGSRGLINQGIGITTPFGGTNR
jgi:hypothetical protein